MTADVELRLHRSRDHEESLVEHSFDLHGELTVFDLVRYLRPGAEWRDIHDKHRTRILIFGNQANHGESLGTDQEIRHASSMVVLLEGGTPRRYRRGPGDGIRLAVFLEHYRPVREPTAAKGADA